MADSAKFTHHMSDEDALMWHIEKDPILRSTIVALAIFDQAPDWDKLRSRIARATHVIPRLRQRVLSPPLRIGPPRWTAESSFDLDFHLRRMRLPAPATERVLLDAVQPIATSSFDRARPLWEFTLFEGLAPAIDGEQERAALVMKVHHAVTDGVGGMALLAQLVDLERDPPELDDATLPAAIAPEFFSRTSLVRDSLAHSRRRFLGIASRVPGTVARAGFGAVRNPLGTTMTATRTLQSIGRILAPATAPMSPVMLDRGLGRRLDVLERSMDDVRRAAKASAGSVNDVFLAAVVGGLQRYHARHGAAPEQLRITMPINLRSGANLEVGNHFVPARFGVPANLDDPDERVRALRLIVREWRAEPALTMTGTLAGILNRLPTTTTTAIFGGMLKCCDFVATNVPGAPVPVYSCGAHVDRLYAFAPPRAPRSTSR